MKNQNAVELGKLGGKARALKISPERRREIARSGGLAGRGIHRSGRPKINKSNIVSVNY